MENQGAMFLLLCVGIGNRLDYKYGCVRLNNSNRPYFDIWIFTFPLHAQINVNFSNFFMWRKSENYPKSELPVDGHY